jgi:hypothetical protein
MAATPRWRWTMSRALAAVALALGIVAVAGSPQPGSGARIDVQDLATIVGGEVDHVSPRELADWIVRGRTDYRLVDLRGAAEYAAYHIPTAENVPVAELPEHGLARNEKIVLYSEGGIHSAQAWFLLKARKYPGAYILSGGLEAWKDEVLFPALPANATRADSVAFAGAAEISRRFGGSPRSGEALAQATPAPELPAVAAPAAPAGTQAPKKKKKEGC